MKSNCLMAVLLVLTSGITVQAQYSKHRIIEDQPPQRVKTIQNIEHAEIEKNLILHLEDYFSDPDEPEASLTYEINRNSHPEVADLSLSGNLLEIDFLTPGQTNVTVKASRNGLFTLDTFAIGVRPAMKGYTVSGFDDIALADNTYWNGSDESGGFISGMAAFSTTYNPDWFSWSGWAISNTTDNRTPGYSNQYSAYSQVRLDSTSGKNYAVGYPLSASEIVMSDSANRKVFGFFVTNSTYAALSMKYGDDYSKKFGGPDGMDPDIFNLAVTGYTQEGDSTGTVNFKLADFSNEDNEKDYIIETWQWVDLLPLGDIYKLAFSLSSTDNGDWGMNTPGYFCMDNLYVGYPSPVITHPAKPSIFVYPNPSSGILRINSQKMEAINVEVIMINGATVFAKNGLLSGDIFDISEIPSGIYLLKITQGATVDVKRIVKQ
ncbi:DUF4465 domain-containing protein [Bacteroidota bacterium]